MKYKRNESGKYIRKQNRSIDYKALKWNSKENTMLRAHQSTQKQVT